MLEDVVIKFFGDFGVWVVVLVSSMLPLIELHGAVPLGIAQEIWGSGAMSIVGASLVAFIGSTLVGILLILLLTPILKLLKKNKKLAKIANSIEKLFNEKLCGLKGSESRKMLLLTLLIALPVPLFGIWTGAGILVFLGVKKWKSILCLTLGNLASAVLMALLCWLFYELIPFLLICMVIIIILMALWYVCLGIYALCHKHKKVV